MRFKESFETLFVAMTLGLLVVPSWPIPDMAELPVWYPIMVGSFLYWSALIVRRWIIKGE